MKVLGVSCFYHDSAAALLADGRVVAAAQEERFSRIKNDASFPHQAIQFCLRKGRTTLSELDAVVFYEKPWLKLERIISSYLDHPHQAGGHFVRHSRSWIEKTLFARNLLNRNLALAAGMGAWNPSILRFCPHHQSHAASAFFASPFSSANIFITDGVGEWATTSIGAGTNNHLTLSSQIDFPHSLGLFYSAMTSYCGFKVNSGEYKLMGLAPFGTPRFTDKILSEILILAAGGSYRLNLKFFEFFDDERIFNGRWEPFFGRAPRRRDEDPLAFKDIAASAQRALEIALVHILNGAPFPSSNDHLVMAGGVALNCVATSAIRKETMYRKLWIQPASGDSGGALGAALAFAQTRQESGPPLPETLKCPGEDLLRGAFLGPDFSDSEIRKVLDRHGILYQQLTEEDLVQTCARQLSEGRVIGWFQGSAEFGPRALGARSILADPRNPDMKRRLNETTKLREPYRPFAPMILQEKCREWFEWDEESPFMTFTAPVLPERRSLIPAVTHVDGSARIQTVDPRRAPRVHRLLRAFEDLTGCPLLVNTSFNVRGEPIVGSPFDALRCFFEARLDFLAIGNCWVSQEANQSLRSGWSSTAFDPDG